MVTEEKYNRAKEKVALEEKVLKNFKDVGKRSKQWFGAGLIGLSYLGARTIIGPEIDFSTKDITNFLQGFDIVVKNVALISLGIGALNRIVYSSDYLKRKGFENNLKKAKSEFEKISEDYWAERGHV
jgi:hypothetical protein